MYTMLNMCCTAAVCTRTFFFIYPAIVYAVNQRQILISEFIEQTLYSFTL